jgi:hypothetical protein
MAKFIVFDHENTQAWGPYDSEAEAEADLVAKAAKDGWGDVLEAATHSGWLSDGSTDRGEGEALVLVELQDKEPLAEGHCEAEYAEHWNDNGNCGMCGGDWVITNDSIEH